MQASEKIGKFLRTREFILQAARLTRWKGQHVLIAAAGRLRRVWSFRDAVVVIVGDHQGRSAYQDELRAAIESAGLNGKVILAGHCIDMPAAFAAAYITVIPSIEPEAFGRASIEAQAMGCPVVVSNDGALPETLGNQGRSGWTVPTADEAALAQAIEVALEMSPDRRAAMAAAAIDNADNFSKTILQKKTLEVYDGLLDASMANAFIKRIGSAEYAHHTA